MVRHHHVTALDLSLPKQPSQIRGERFCPGPDVERLIIMACGRLSSRSSSLGNISRQPCPLVYLFCIPQNLGVHIYYYTINESTNHREGDATRNRQSAAGVRRTERPLPRISPTSISLRHHQARPADLSRASGLISSLPYQPPSEEKTRDTKRDPSSRVYRQQAIQL
ncbi:uncharacterized protein K489DRAFT_18996 [Dissoconium aciculare CBS 342.82]|uniref:Uncharacterized protein n=1 Tax=Dissoconium aciculare CBS 342.82 TaxID=1314786 RepID=A0A6J3MHT4_9PEZI|nr:uncharacterized protein K489DRAFT_18996 [Dissoconium aciculare CBS 342.82]KAF1827516.1 hypothetical protein K489DRAFT_18996 [Dissoconium aciculare CBS 342.82]